MEKLASPVSVVFLKDLEDRSIDSPKKLSGIVPNLHIPDYGSAMTSSIYMRGFGSRMENPVLGMYIDDVPVLNKNAYDIEMLDIRRVDLLRGPQGTLYGRNSMCGVLSLSTLSPSVYSGVRASVECGSAGQFSARTSVYRKTSGDLAVGGALSYRHSDGFFLNEFNGNECDPYDGISARLRIEKSLRPDLYFENILHAGVLSQGGWPYRQYLHETGVLLPVAYNDICEYKRLNVTESIKLRFEDERFTLSSISALNLLLDRMDMDQDFTTSSMFTLAQIQRECAVTQEIVLKPQDRWKKSWWNWQSGAFLFYRHNDMSAPVVFKQDGIDNLILSNANDNIPEDIADGYKDPLAIREESFPIGSDFGMNTFGAALYHESYFTFGRWMLTAGLRLDYEGDMMNYESNASIHYKFRPTMSDWKLYRTVYAGKLQNHYVELLPKLSVIYDLSSSSVHANVFGVISKGYRSGGFNTQIFSDILQNMMMNGLMADLGVYLDSETVGVRAEDTAYRPEKSWNYEIGGKLDVNRGGHHFNGAASVFYISCRDQQITLFPPGQSTGRMMANVGRSRSIGAEALAAYDYGGFSCSISYGLTDARFTRYDDGNNDYSGNVIPYSPRQTLNVRAGYRFEFPGDVFRSLSLNADCSATGKIYWDEANTLTESVRALLGADISFGFKWFDLRLRADNLTNEDYNTFYFKSVGNSFFQKGKPFRWMAGISIEL